MDYLKRVFQCAKPSSHFSTNDARQSRDVSEIADSSGKAAKVRPPPPPDSHLHYKQQHIASLAESQAVFELQKKYIEKRIHHINLQVEKVDRASISDLRQKIVQIEKTCQDLQNKLDTLKGDAEWVKFE